MQQWKNEILNERRLTMEHRLDRAEQKRQLQLQIKVRKAHEEETKVTFTLVLCFQNFVWIRNPPLSVWPHLFRGAAHEKRRGEQLKWSLAFSLYIGSFPCAQLPGPVHTARLGRVFFLCI